MRELFKLDAVMQRISALLKKGNKVKEIIKIFAFTWTVFNVIAVIWSFVPKYEKMSEVEAQELIEALTDPEKENPGEPIPQELVEA